MTLLNTNEVASRLGITPARVRALIDAGKLPAQKVGRDWIIDERDLAKVAERPVGYPKGKPRAKDATGKV